MFLVARVFTILAGLVVLVECDENSSGVKSIPKTLDFGAYVDKYGKNYDETETLARANIFYARTIGIFKTNSKYLAKQNNYYLKQNEYTDVTANEAKRTLVSKDIDLTPVYGANQSPELPADKFMEMQKDIKQQRREGYSQASLGGTNSRVDGVDFFAEVSDKQAVDPKELLQQLMSHSDVAERMADVLEAPKSTEGDDEVQIESRKPFKPLVPPSNKNYDPSLIPSYAWSDTVEEAGRNFANIMMEDFMTDLEPYPTPEIPKKRVLTDDMLPPSKKSILTDVMSSIKTIYDYWNSDDGMVVDPEENVLIKDDEDEEEDAKSSSHKEENAKMIEIAASNSQVKKTVFDVDWRRSGCISKAKSQSKCNSCYAFATLDLMEFFYCRQKETQTEFSVQYIVDCGVKTELNGCQGGKLSNVGLFIQKYGLQLNAAYPYNGREQQCPFDKSDEQKAYALKPTISGWRNFPDIQAWYRWLPKSPIVVGINMPTDFLAYGGGVHDGKDCVPGMVHAMLLVGSGNQDGKPFWFLKNTFSDSWGEEGYFKLSKRAPIKCFNSAVVVRAKFDASTTTTSE